MRGKTFQFIDACLLCHLPILDRLTGATDHSTFHQNIIRKNIVSQIRSEDILMPKDYWDKSGFRYAMLALKIRIRRNTASARGGGRGKSYMVAHHIVVQHKLNEHCAQRFVSNKHFSKLLLFCTY